MRPEMYMALALLFLAHGVPSNAQGEEVRVTVEEGAPLTVECRVRVEQRAEWRLDGGPAPRDLRPGEAPLEAGAAGGAGGAGGGLAARLSSPAARAQHAGRYTCSRDPRAAAVRVLVLPAAPARPLRTNGAAPAELPVHFYDVGCAIVLNCSQLVDTNNKQPITWSKNGTAVEKVGELSGRYELVEGGAVFRSVGRTLEDDFGNYSCAAGGASLGWQVHGKPYAKLPPNTNVVEGQKLKITCKVTGKPHPSVSWTFKNSSEVNATAVQEALGERAQLAASEQGVAGAELVLEAARPEDAGEYRCVLRGQAAAEGAPTVLRVKDMYAALWPFLGICAEVFVLCAVILVYEKRRTKPELDDSDTDNHDQKKS